MTAGRKRGSASRGFTLIELLVTMSILAISLTTLVPVSRRVAVMSNASTGQTQRVAALMGEVMRAEVVPFDSLAIGLTCTGSGTAFPYLACLRVTAINSRTRSVLVVVTPTGIPIGPDSATIERSRPAAGNPLNLP